MRPAGPPINQNHTQALFATLEDRGVRYAVWKDIDDVGTFWRGDAELDLLVHQNDIENFRRIAVAHHFAEYRNRIDIYGGQITHFIHFSVEGYYHFHVYQSLLTGDHVIKEYCLDPLFVDQPIFDGPICAGIRTLEKVDELAIGIIRLFLKASSSTGVKVTELTRMRSIYSADLFSAAANVIRQGIDFPSTAVELIRGVLEGSAACLNELSEHVGAFSSLRRVGRLQALFWNGSLRTRSRLAGRLGLSNKLLTAKAPTMAIIGVDGSGKSSIAGALQRKLRSKVSAKHFYLGGNTGTYTVMTWVSYLFHRVSALASRLVTSSVLLRDLRMIFLAVFEYCKCRDRAKKIRRAGRYARRGVIVIFERYPMKHLFDYPQLALQLKRGEVQLRPWAHRIVGRLLSCIDKLLDDVGPADITALIDTDYDIIEARRRLRDDERVDIRSKLVTWHQFQQRQSRSQIFVIDNKGPIEHALAEAFELLDIRLCSLSS